MLVGWSLIRAAKRKASKILGQNLMVPLRHNQFNNRQARSLACIRWNVCYSNMQQFVQAAYLHQNPNCIKRTRIETIYIYIYVAYNICVCRKTRVQKVPATQILFEHHASLLSMEQLGLQSER